jgi:ribosomal protein S18 acetylase RimI-like enzyme
VAVVVRAARPGEELAVAAIHVRSWQEAYHELMPAEFLAGLDPRDRAGRYDFGGGEGAPRTLVAVDDGRIAGFVTFGASRDDDARGLGEIIALYVDPERYQAGLGSTLMEAARAALRDSCYEAAILWVLDGNDRAARFYEGEGWTRDGARREENVYGIASNVTRFRRRLR